MSAVHPPSNPSATISDTSTLTEGIAFPSGFVRAEITRVLQREQEKAIALLETSPLLSYLFFTHVISAKTTPDSPVSDQSEELSALKQQSEKLESDLVAAQVALAEAHTIVESLREEVQQLKADMLEERSRHAAVVEEWGADNEDLRREIHKYKSEGEALQKITATQQLEIVRTKQQSTAEKAVLHTRLDELQRRFDDLTSTKREAVVTPAISAFEESTNGRMTQSPEQPTPPRPSQHDPRVLRLIEPSSVVQQASSPSEVAPLEPSTPQVPTFPSDIQTSESPSPVRQSRAQKFKAKRTAKKRAEQEAREEAGTNGTRTEVINEPS